MPFASSSINSNRNNDHRLSSLSRSPSSTSNFSYTSSSSKASSSSARENGGDILSRHFAFEARVSLRRYKIKSLSPARRFIVVEGGAYPSIAVYKQRPATLLQSPSSPGGGGSERRSCQPTPPLDVLLLDSSSSISISKSKLLQVEIRSSSLRRGQHWTVHFESTADLVTAMSPIKAWTTLSQFIGHTLQRPESQVRLSPSLTKCTDTRTQESYTIRRVDGASPELDILRKLKSASSLLKNFAVPVTYLYEGEENRDVVHVVTPFIAGGSLKTTIATFPRGVVPEDEAIELFRKIVASVRRVHRNGILNLDLSPSNILFSSEDLSTSNALLSKFTSASYIRTDANAAAIQRHSIQPKKSLKAFSPDSVRATWSAKGAGSSSKQDSGIQADLQSAGKLLHQILTGKAPRERDLMKYRLLGDEMSYFKTPEWKGVSKNMQSLVARLLGMSLKFRNFTQVANHSVLHIDQPEGGAADAVYNFYKTPNRI